MNYVQYALTDYWVENQDLRVLQYPFMSGGMIPILSLVALYVIAVVYVGPWLMRNRAPFELRRVILAYNLFNIFTNLYFLHKTLTMSNYGRLLFKFTPEPRDDYSERTLDIVFHVWLYFLLKISDFIETIFFVMRRKQSQVSFLHVYHHSTVPIMIWMGFKLYPTSHIAGLFPLLNCTIHVVMYTYYFFAALGPQYQRYLWWKKYITVMQLAQFVIFIVVGVFFILYQEGFPAIAMWIPNVQSPIFFYMFYKFYTQSYHKSEEKKLD